jgi:hypothetical protein
MKSRGRSLAGLLLVSALVACAGISPQLRRYTYPPDFNYIEQEQLHSAMWQLAGNVRELDRAVRAAGPIDGARRQEILKLLISMESATARLGTEGRASNHPVIDDHLPVLRRDIALARKGVEGDPPNYVLVGLLPGACMYCHSRGR